ncbi:MAG: hypothetical protein M3N49_15720, partial [Candidatus Eremiobacteraeota bacterium]|nr:hypothetical protein [Candidatus Eremiobacteraeota bacterium]
MMAIVRCAAGAACHLGSWILPMYFAGRLEHANIREYEDGAEYAHALGLPDFERALLAMAASNGSTKRCSCARSRRIRGSPPSNAFSHGASPHVRWIRRSASR